MHHSVNDKLFPDNPYATADKWLLKENLPVSYRQQVVEFILQNTGQKNFSLDTSFRDPYTGGKNYELWFSLFSISHIDIFFFQLHTLYCC